MSRSHKLKSGPKVKCIIIWLWKESFLRQRVFPNLPVEYLTVFMLKMRVRIEGVFTCGLPREMCGLEKSPRVNHLLIPWALQTQVWVSRVRFPFYNTSTSVRRDTLKYIHWIREAFILTLALLKRLTVLLDKLQLLIQQISHLPNDD